MECKETFSEYIYIRIRLKSGSQPVGNQSLRAEKLEEKKQFGWALKKLNENMPVAASHVHSWKDTPPTAANNNGGEAKRLEQALVDICRTAMSSVITIRKVQSAGGRQNSSTREEPIYQPADMKHCYVREVEVLYRYYRESVMTLQRLIKTARTRVWNEITNALDCDP